jgi:hypothetical protein
MFPSSDEGRETPTLLGPLKGSNLNYSVHSPSPNLKKETSNFKKLFSTYLAFLLMDKFQNPSESEYVTIW